MKGSMIATITKTCESCPAQWNGELIDGRHLYVRYRHGVLSIGVGATHGEAVRSHVYYSKDLPRDADGTMGDSEMMEHLTAFLENRGES